MKIAIQKEDSLIKDCHITVQGASAEAAVRVPSIEIKVYPSVWICKLAMVI
jgi:hypothetical protein